MSVRDMDMKDLTPLLDYDESKIKQLMGIDRNKESEAPLTVLISTKHINVVSGLDNILKLDISSSNQLHANISTDMDDEILKRAILKLSEVTTSDVHLELEIKGKKKQKSLDIATEVFSSLKISELKLVFKPTYLGGFGVNKKQQLIDKIMNIRGLNNFEYWASKEKRTYFIRNLQYGRKDLFKLILEKSFFGKNKKEVRNDFIDFII